MRRQETREADRLFQDGHFVAAEAAYARSLSVVPARVQTLTRLATIALLGDRLAEAERWATQALTLGSQRPAARRWLDHLARSWRGATAASPEALLGEIFYRRGDFRQAAPCFRAVGRSALAATLESFGDARPYQLEGAAEATRLPFVMVDPLPVVQARLNGGPPVNLFLDTGGAELILDAEFAGELGAARFGGEPGTFGGGRRATYQHGRVDSVTLADDLIVHHVPVTIMNVRQFSGPVFDGRRVDGIIGTRFLYQFLATVDYPAGELVLRRKTAANRHRFEEEMRTMQPITVPFWLADHVMVAWGTLNRRHRLLLFLDTGLAGLGFTCPPSTLKEAGLSVPARRGTAGIGGGGNIATVPLVVDEIALGEASARQLPGAFGPFPPQLERAFGFRIGGLISHAFFRPYALTLDFQGMRCWLVGVPTPVARPGRPVV